MRKIIKRLLTVSCILLLIGIALPSYLYAQRANNHTVFGKDIPCTYLTEHSIGEYFDNHEDDMARHYSQEPLSGSSGEYVNTFVVWAGTGNVNSLAGIEQLVNKEEIEQIILPGTCVSQVEGLDVFPNLISIDVSGANLTSTKSLEGLEGLEVASLYNNPIETIEGIENIRTNTENTLEIKMSPDDLKYITQESYDYIIDPANNVDMFFSSSDYGLGSYNASEDGLPSDSNNYLIQYLVETVEII